MVLQYLTTLLECTDRIWHKTHLCKTRLTSDVDYLETKGSIRLIDMPTGVPLLVWRNLW
ncbi:hypothetical protein DPMN_057975 [Dreissena polymorpha]|uniref:Uncharacterized protein n=1 Tax=Dreissena polymorpha TaxID=45954 RepID=A0A9D4C157_DREPO|nr:hypothetical protein DPMN_057975 [Dreissena polymorpha]